MKPRILGSFRSLLSGGSGGMSMASGTPENPRKIQIPVPSLSCRVEGGGRPLLFVHGLGGNRDAWREVAQLLRGDHTVLSIDLPGSGRSAPPRKRHGCADFEGIADDLASTARELVQGPCFIIGHSMGGYLAAMAVARHPDLFRGLVLVDQGLRPGLPAPPGWQARLEKDPQSFLETLLTPTVKSAEERHRILRDAARVDKGVLAAYLAHMGWKAPGVGILPSDFPVLACVREAPPPGSPRFRRWLERMGFNGIRNLRVEPFPKASHWLMWDDPARFAATLRAFEAWVEAGLP